MKKNERKNKRTEAAELQKELCKLATTVGWDGNLEDEQTGKIYDLVRYMNECNMGSAVENVLHDQSIPEFSQDIIGGAHHYACYRPRFIMECGEKKELLSVLPFAIQITAIIRSSTDPADFTCTLPDTVKKLTNDKILRDVLKLGDRDIVTTDGLLYRGDLPEWGNGPAVRKYIQSVAEFICGKKDRFTPLSSSFSQPPVAGESFGSGNGPAALIAHRFMIVCVFTDWRNLANLEDRMMNSAHQVQPITDVIRDEFSKKGLVYSDVQVMECFVELGSILETTLLSNNQIGLSMIAEATMRNLCTVPGCHPEWDVSLVPVNGIPAFNIQAYLHGAQRRLLFQFPWRMRCVEDAELGLAFDAIMDTAKKYDAYVIMK